MQGLYFSTTVPKETDIAPLKNGGCKIFEDKFPVSIVQLPKAIIA